VRSVWPELEIEIRSADGASVLGRAPASLGPIVEDATFRAVLDGRLPNDGRMPDFEIELRPADAPDGRVETVSLLRRGAAADDYAWTAFATQSQVAVEALVERRVLERDASVRWRLARANADPARRPRRTRLCGAPYPLRSGALPGRARGAFEVAIASHVLRERRDRLLAGSGVESAALLLGSLLVDAARGAAQLLVLDALELPAGRGGASAHHFAFDPDTFARARRALDESPDLVAVGWHHEHVACADCALTPACERDTIFFSSDDYAVHASAFPRAYHVALVAGKLRERPARDPGFRLYGWDCGEIRELPVLEMED